MRSLIVNVSVSRPRKRCLRERGGLFRRKDEFDRGNETDGSRATFAINGWIMIQDEETGVPSRIWPGDSCCCFFFFFFFFFLFFFFSIPIANDCCAKMVADETLSCKLSNRQAYDDFFYENDARIKEHETLRGEKQRNMSWLVNCNFHLWQKHASSLTIN